MKMVINAPFSKEEFIRLAKFLREMWQHTDQKCFISIHEGTEDMTKEECLKMFREIFKDSPEYTEVVFTKDEIEEFHRRTR